MKLTITTVRNGYVITSHEDDEDDETHVIEGEGPEAAEKLAYLMWDLLGLRGSRYDARRPGVVLEPGDKYGD